MIATEALNQQVRPERRVIWEVPATTWCGRVVQWLRHKLCDLILAIVHLFTGVAPLVVEFSPPPVSPDAPPPSLEDSVVSILDVPEEEEKAVSLAQTPTTQSDEEHCTTVASDTKSVDSVRFIEDLSTTEILEFANGKF